MTATLSAYSQIQAGKAQARGLAAQATQTRIETRSEALKYKQQGVAVLDNILQTQANMLARAGAGNVDPFSGSAMALRYRALAKGSEEFYLTKEGATIVTATGEAQANEYIRQGRAVMQGAILGAGITLGTAAVSAGGIGGPPTG